MLILRRSESYPTDEVIVQLFIENSETGKPYPNRTGVPLTSTIISLKRMRSSVRSRPWPPVVFASQDTGFRSANNNLLARSPSNAGFRTLEAPVNEQTPAFEGLEVGTALFVVRQDQYQ